MRKTRFVLYATGIPHSDFCLIWIRHVHACRCHSAIWPPCVSKLFAIVCKAFQSLCVSKLFVNLIIPNFVAHVIIYLPNKYQVLLTIKCIWKDTYHGKMQHKSMMFISPLDFLRHYYLGFGGGHQCHHHHHLTKYQETQHSNVLQSRPNSESPTWSVWDICQLLLLALITCSPIWFCPAVQWNMFWKSCSKIEYFWAELPW